MNIGNPLKAHGRIQLMEERKVLLKMFVVMYLNVLIPYSLVIHRKVLSKCFSDKPSKAWLKRVLYNLV
ncbi:hypothetical protein ACQP3C_27890, partial [Escherichia coli]